tara:strand:- start:856 stop:1473 length:618 start_codon:yes stop_codon:yes gene_type:complete
MPIQPDIVYSIKEVSEILKINTRRIQRIAKKHKVEKVDNRYIFKGTFLMLVFADTIKALSQDVSHKAAEVSQDSQVKEVENAALKREIEILKSNLQEYEISDNERIEVFTKDEFRLFETRLIEWQHQQKEIEKKETEIAEIKATTSERVEHYKNLFEYQRKQSDRILQIHEKLVTSINELTKANVQRNIIEAKDKDVINHRWKPK